MTWRITTDDILEQYKNGERNFNGIELIRIIGEMGERDGVDGNITGLEGADLSDISLRGANLQGARLPGFGFERSNLTRANFKDAVHYTRGDICCRSNLIWNTIMPDGSIEGQRPYIEQHPYMYGNREIKGERIFP